MTLNMRPRPDLSIPKVRGTTVYTPLPTLIDSDTLFEADLADMLRSRAVRQLLISFTPHGWQVRVLPTWKLEFMTLVSLKKEHRHYRDLDRLLRNVTRHGPLPPTILKEEM